MARRETLAAARKRYAADAMVYARKRGIDHVRVEAAFAAVPRERYLPPPPWHIFMPGLIPEEETSDPSALYQDILVVLDRGKGINNGQPSLHAVWMAGVDPRPGETILQIGIGSGYYTAILAELVGPAGRVEAYEIEPRLAALARENLAGLPQVAVHAASAIGTSLPAADLVYVSAGAPAPDAAWLTALREGGRLVMPWQPRPWQGRTMIVRRAGGRYRVAFHGTAAFIGCVGAAPGEGREGGDLRPVAESRTIVLASDRRPDESATAIFPEVWFSASER